MKITKTASAIIALLAFAVAAAAQQTSTGPAQAGTPGVLQKSKVAVIDTEVFQSQIGEFKTAIDGLNRQFEARMKDLQSQADKINALETTIKTQSQVLGAAKIAEMTEQVDTMKRDYQRKGEDLQADVGRARDRAFEPISNKLGKFAEDYTKRRGITMLVDIANASQSGMVVWHDPRLDVTKDFIAEYNKAHPSAVPAPPSPANKQP